LEHKLALGRSELDKIIRTKVFSRGKQLVYELDLSSRQLRLLKDNVFQMEKRLSDQIYVSFERELNQTKMELNEYKKKFAEYQAAMATVVNADVRENINSIDAIMKGKAELFKDLSRSVPRSSLSH
jgi:septation ring formation regulator EzrA